MANKKTKKKHKKLKKTGPKKPSAAKKPAKKTLAKKKPAAKKAKTKKTVGKKTAGSKPAGARKRRLPARGTEPFQLPELRSRSAGRSGDLQGLSDNESADSESVDELLEEGNAFEADVVAGVESAGDNDEKEVHTHEVPEDDVPGEYLDEE
jgi:hypothetical protein